MNRTKSLHQGRRDADTEDLIQICEQLTTPLAGNYDVIVCGGGPAGVAAAVSAARCGKRTLLIEQQGCLGGVWTSGLLCYVLDADNKGGLIQEILLSVAQEGQSERCFYQPERMKVVLDALCAEAEVDVLLHTLLVSAESQNGLIASVTTESRTGRQAWVARQFIDATGDGTLCARAGCSFEIGDPQTGKCQPATLMAMVSLHDDLAAPFVIGHGPGFATRKTAFREYLESLGHTPSYSSPSLFRVATGLYALMVNHEYGVDPLSAQSVSVATATARREILAITDLLHASEKFRGLRLVTTAAQLGIREARRIRGIYQLSAGDLSAGARFEDEVCEVTFPVDIHSLRKEDGGGYSSHGVVSRPYGIPLRALMSAEFSNLWMAGRCISGDFVAHGSYRVTGNAVPMGEAVGHAAAKMCDQPGWNRSERATVLTRSLKL